MNISNNAAPAITFKGKTAAKRMAAMSKVAPLSFIAEQSRSELIVELGIALGARPSQAVIDCARDEFVIGRMAQRLPAGELPKGCKSPADRLAAARSLYLNHAQPNAKKLGAGKIGRRSEGQQKVLRAATEAWSQVKAELGLGNAQTQAERNAKKKDDKRAPNRAFKVPAPVVASDLPAPKEMDADTIVTYLTSQSATLEAFCKKFAKLVPTTHNETVECVMHLRTLAMAAANAYGERKAAEQAKAAEKEKENA